MALIRINIADTLLSESAAKKPGYHFGKVGGANALVISSEHKPAVSKCISNARKAQKLALSALKNRIEANTIAAVKVPQATTPDRKTKLRQRVKAMKTKAAADAKTAKQLLREGVAAMKKAGLSALSSPLKASDISLGSEPGRSARTIRAAQTDSLVVKGKKGYIKPKFLAASKFAALGEKKAAKKTPAKKATGTKKASTPKAAKAKPKNENSLWRHYDKSSGPKGEQYQTQHVKNVALGNRMREDSANWDRETRKSKRMLKELNGGKSLTLAQGWTGSVKNGKGVFTDKKGKKLVVTAADMKRHGLTAKQFERALGESYIEDPTAWDDYNKLYGKK